MRSCTIKKTHIITFQTQVHTSRYRKELLFVEQDTNAERRLYMNKKKNTKQSSILSQSRNEVIMMRTKNKVY